MKDGGVFSRPLDVLIPSLLHDIYNKEMSMTRQNVGPKNFEPLLDQKIKILRSK